MDMKKIKISNKHDFFKFFKVAKKQKFFENFEFSQSIVQKLLAEESASLTTITDRIPTNLELEKLKKGLYLPYRVKK